MAQDKIDILLLGAGGREHALLMKLAESPRAGKLYVAPGNGGMLQLAEAAPVNQENPAEVAAWATEHGIGVVKDVLLQISKRERDLMRQVKACFDPHGIMNPGKGY